MTPRRGFAGDWAQEISNAFSSLRKKAKQNSLRLIHAEFPTLVRTLQLPFRTIRVRKLSQWASKTGARFGALGYVYTGSFVDAMNKVAPSYQEIGNIRQTQGYQQIPSDQLQPLDERWNAIDATHNQLTGQAPDLDSINDALGPEKQNLDSEGADLAERQDQLKSDIDNYNQSCAGKTLPPEEYQQCVSSRNDLQSRQSQLNSDISQYNEKGNDFNARLNDLKSSGSQWIEIFKSWVSDVKQWGQDVEQALSGSRYGDCTEEQHRELQNAVDLACKLPKGQGWACKEGQSRDILQANLAKGQKCYQARMAITNICYRGVPIPGHKQQINGVLAGIQTCQDLIGQVCGEGVDAFAPWQ